VVSCSSPAPSISLSPESIHSTRAGRVIAKRSEFDLLPKTWQSRLPHNSAPYQRLAGAALAFVSGTVFSAARCCVAAGPEHEFGRFRAQRDYRSKYLNGYARVATETGRWTKKGWRADLMRNKHVCAFYLGSKSWNNCDRVSQHCVPPDGLCGFGLQPPITPKQSGSRRRLSLASLRRPVHCSRWTDIWAAQRRRGTAQRKRELRRHARRPKPGG
jgi:hypothetical protein